MRNEPFHYKMDFQEYFGSILINQLVDWAWLRGGNYRVAHPESQSQNPGIEIDLIFKGFRDFIMQPFYLGSKFEL